MKHGKAPAGISIHFKRSPCEAPAKRLTSRLLIPKRIATFAPTARTPRWRNW